MMNYVTVTVSMLPKFKKKLDEMSVKLGIPRSVLIRKAVLDFINSKPTKGEFKREY